MKIALFGATGGTGQFVVHHALRRGYHIKALIRDPKKLKHNGTNLKITKGDILEANKVQHVVEGADAVICTLSPTDNKPDMIISQGMSIILEAMKAHDVKRLIVTANPPQTDENPRSLIDRINHFITQTFSGNKIKDMAQVVELVQQSDTQWTIAHAPELSDDPASGDFQVDLIGNDLVDGQLSREDFAQFLLAQIENDNYLQQSVVIRN